MEKININKDENCIFCYSLLFSNLIIEFNNIPSIKTNCFLGHSKENDFSLFFELNNHSFDNNKLKIECPNCIEISDKDMFFICLETHKLICPKCIALNIVISSSKGKKKKTKKNDKKQPHYSTLIYLLKYSIQETKEEINNNLLYEKRI